MPPNAGGGGRQRLAVDRRGGAGRAGRAGDLLGARRAAADQASSESRSMPSSRFHGLHSLSQDRRNGSVVSSRSGEYVRSAPPQARRRTPLQIVAIARISQARFDRNGLDRPNASDTLYLSARETKYVTVTRQRAGGPSRYNESGGAAAGLESRPDFVPGTMGMFSEAGRPSADIAARGAR